MPQSYRSRWFDGSSQRAQRTQERVWMEMLEGRLLLSVENAGDLVPDEPGNSTIGAIEEADDHGNRAADATVLQVGTKMDGKIQYADDRDWFAVEVVAGETYVFTLDGQGNSGGRPSDHEGRHFAPNLLLNLFDQQAQLVSGHSNFTAFEERMEYTAQASGKMYARVAGYRELAPYTMSVSKLQDDPQRPAEIEVGETVSGSLEKFGDVARYRVWLEAGKTYVKNAQVSNGNARLVQADGRYDWGWECVDADCRLALLTPTESRAYYAEVGAWGSTGYSVRVDEYVPPPPPPAPALAKPLDFQKGDGTAGELADEQDVRGFSFAAEAGRKYIFQTALGSLEDSTLTLYDANAEILVDNDDVSNDDLSSRIEWTAENSGIYYIVVGGFGGGSFELYAHQEEGEQRTEFKLDALGVEDARARFGYDTSTDDEESDDQADSWLSDDEDVLDSSDDWDWGNL